MKLRNFRYAASIARFALGVVVVVPALADPIDPTGGSGPTRRVRTGLPTNPVVTPPVVTTPPPAPANTNPPPTPAITNPAPTGATPPPVTNVPTGPIFLGSATDLGQQPTLSGVLSRLNGQIDLYNTSAINDLPDADLDGARLVVPGGTAPVSQAVVVDSTPPTEPLVQSSTDGITRRSRSVTPPPVIVPPPAPTSPSITEITVDVTGWSYIVLKWGDVNHHFYVGDISGSQTFRGAVSLSSYSFFQAQVTPIPEGGSTLLLLCGAVGVLAHLRRRRSA